MKRLVLLLLALVATLGIAAQSEQDFATRFMSLYGDDYEMARKTISPKMMERIMQLKPVDDNSNTRHVLKQIKSFSILSANSNNHGAELFRKAVTLAKCNAKRYSPYNEREELKIYVRKRGKVIVEMVVIGLKDTNAFHLIDITGNLSDDFIQQVIAL